ncbi:hypothetical protein [Bacillus safensis]|uniref:hypothetical protein n=1 Tax=Bacillus safensis TaxID=561879 RepID=UPI001BAC5CA5|nr:hypothetical protein [Bacillus safensis]MBR0640324.1 hypothetical protein [Bacillus safensis]
MKTHECECPTEGEFEGRTYLYIRTNPADRGLEPRPSEMLCVVSPDIIVIKPDGSRGIEAVARELNHIEVIITNSGGIIANDAYVEVFFGGPATGFVATNAQKIGGHYVTVQGYSTASVKIPWIPEETGHLCLTARVSLVAPPDTYRDPDVFDIQRDRHLAQRNINIIDLGGDDSFKFEFDLVNPAVDNTGELLLQVQFINASVMEETINKAVGCCFARFSKDLFGKIHLKINGDTVYEDNGVYSVYVPEGEIRKVELYVEKYTEIHNTCGVLHLLEIKLLENTGRTIGGVWVVIKP